MMIVLHVVSALVSVLFTAYAFMIPSRLKLAASYGLLALTLGSGTYLTVRTPDHMVEACMMGLAYTGLVMTGIVSTHYRLAGQDK